jgi:hypothetical protein
LIRLDQNPEYSNFSDLGFPKPSKGFSERSTKILAIFLIEILFPDYLCFSIS